MKIDSDTPRVDWAEAKARLVEDSFDNGRTPDALRRSFENSQHVAFAWSDDDGLVGMARLLSDGVCNAYLVDVWTYTPHRRRGVASAMMRHLMDKVPGQHIGLQTDDAQAMAQAIAGELGIAPDAVGIKAKTNEGMGFVGRGEGVAVFAVATVEERPSKTS